MEVYNQEVKRQQAEQLKKAKEKTKEDRLTTAWQIKESF